MNINQGYQLKVSNNCTLSLEGEVISPENTPIEVQEGWNIISYLRLENANAQLVLEEVQEQIVIVKNYLGNAYLPDWNFNGIGDFEPGQGYHMKASSDFELQYISNTDEYRTTDVKTVLNNSTRQPISLNTGSNMHLVIPENIWNSTRSIDDEIYAFDAEGTIVGAAKLTFPNTVICIWGDDILTKEKEGLYAAEEINFKLWNAKTKRESEIQIKASSETYFKQNRLIIATEASNNGNENTFQLMDAIPNPAKDQALIRLYLENDSELQLELFDIIGNKVLELAKGAYSKGYHEFNIDVNTLSSGSYLYQISCNKERKSKRLEIVK